MKKGVSFGKAFATYFCDGIILQLILSVVAAVAAIAISITDSDNSNFWSDGLFGSTFLYILIGVWTVCFIRACAGRGYGYDDIKNGRWNLLTASGSSKFNLCFAKFLGSLLLPLFGFAVGAGVVFAVQYFFGPLENVSGALLLLAIGALATVAIALFQILFGALGAGNALRFLMTLPTMALILGSWYFCGMFTAEDVETVQASAVRVLQLLPPGMLLVVGVLLLLCVLVALTVPGKRISRYDVEEISDEMLKKLQFNRELTVYEKDGDEYKLVFAGKDIE